MVALSKRLEAVAALAGPGKTAADVGCDHGYVAIRLIQQGLFSKVVAVDVRPGPLAAARKNVALYGMEDSVELRLSDGLRMLGTGEADSMVCAGMGGALICRILENDAEKAKAMKQIILQPQSEISLVRSFLRQHGYAVVKEDMVKEDGKYYPMLRAVWQGEQTDPPTDRADIYDAYGKLLLEGRHPVLCEWLLHEQKVIGEIISGLQETDEAGHNMEANNAAEHNITEHNTVESNTDRRKQRLEELQEKRRRIEEALSYFI